jgi:hypothetical protein
MRRHVNHFVCSMCIVGDITSASSRIHPIRMHNQTVPPPAGNQERLHTSTACLYTSAMVTSTSTPGSMEMLVICFTTSAGLCRSISRLWILHTNTTLQLRMWPPATWYPKSGSSHLQCMVQTCVSRTASRSGPTCLCPHRTATSGW